MRPRRSVLFVPGSNERALAKAATLSCDVMIFDLEDSVAPELKGRARENLRPPGSQQPGAASPCARSLSRTMILSGDGTAHGVSRQQVAQAAFPAATPLE